MPIQVHFKSSTKPWATPWPLFELLHARYQFTVDVCATADNAKLPRYFAPEQDGLRQSWVGERAWMNPPYGRAIVDWVRKASSAKAELVVGLLPARTDARWWHDHVLHKAYRVHFLRGRITFENAPAPAPFPSALVLWQSEAGASHIRKSISGHNLPFWETRHSRTPFRGKPR